MQTSKADQDFNQDLNGKYNIAFIDASYIWELVVITPKLLLEIMKESVPSDDSDAQEDTHCQSPVETSTDVTQDDVNRTASDQHTAAAIVEAASGADPASETHEDVGSTSTNSDYSEWVDILAMEELIPIVSRVGLSPDVYQELSTFLQQSLAEVNDLRTERKLTEIESHLKRLLPYPIALLEKLRSAAAVPRDQPRGTEPSQSETLPSLPLDILFCGGCILLCFVSCMYPNR